MTAASSAGQNPVVDGLQQVLRAHHAAVFGYPVIGTHLDDEGQVGQARTDEAAHRLGRDVLAAQLVSLGVTPVATEANYAPPTKLISAATGWQWAVALEQQTAAGYRYLLVCAVRAGGNQPIRRQAMTGLLTAATTAMHWRRLLTPDRPTVAFPGA